MDSLAHLTGALRDALRNVPAFVDPFVTVILALSLALLAHWLVFRLLYRVIDTSIGLRATILRHVRPPMRLAFLLIGLIVALPRSSLPRNWEGWLQHLALILLIILLGWTVLLLTDLYTKRSVSRYRFDIDDNLVARKYVTQVRLLRRAIDIVVVIFTVAGVLLTFEGVQQYGVSLFASAGAAGLVLGLAARPVLANLIAGIQIALTQPIRLEDVVIVEGEWGWIEDIYATYVVVRLWDWRRMIIPLSYFIEQPFENWTRETASIIGVVTWHFDYSVPVETLRKTLEDLVKSSPYWDGRVINLQVIETHRDTIVLRGLMSARNAPQAWDLRCDIREKLITWMQQHHPEALPRLRWEPERPGGAADHPKAGYPTGLNPGKDSSPE